MDQTTRFRSLSFSDSPSNGGSGLPDITTRQQLMMPKCRAP